MHIDRYNYETFFLLYTDNELSMADRQAVEAFVQQNPDLVPELEMLQQYIFTPDPQVVFSNKASLLQTIESNQLIQPDNCTTYFLLYADNELSKPKRAAVEQFVHDQPQFSAEFALLCTIKLVPDEALAFGNKKRLYRYEKNMPVIGRWWRSAAAAMLLLGAGALWQQLRQLPAPLQRPVAVNRVHHPAGSRKANTTGNAQMQMAGVPPSQGPMPVPATPAVAKRPAQKTQAATTDGEKAIRHTVSTGAHITDDQVLTALNNKSIHPSGISSSIIPADPADYPAAITAGPPASNRLVTSQGIIPAVAEAGSGASEALLASDTHTENVIFANIPVQRKSALRGLFRKASRFIDKTTALKTGQAQGIQIGNIEIAFQ